MAKLNSCPVDAGPLDFFGISQQKTGQLIEDDAGEFVPEVEAFRWQQCSTCATFTRENFFGAILSFQKEEPDKKLFWRNRGKESDD